MKHCCKILLALATCLATADAMATDKEEYLPYGNMNSWTIRKIKESGVIGGDTKTLYEVGPNRTITGNTPYTNGGGSPWGTSNVMAKVMGVVKTNNSVYRDKHGSGYCAKLETHIEKVRVLGLMNMKVLAAGSLFLGDMKEPITGTKDGPKAMNNGIHFTKRPKALKFDYIDGATGEVKYVEAAPGSAAYRSYWSQFIADFAQHLRDKGWFGKTMIAMDERPLDAMQAALDVIKSVEPEFKVSLAGNYHPEIEKDLYDLCIAFRASYPEDVLARRHAEGKVTTLYTCCAEAYPNMFIVSPPYEAAWLAWRALATDCDGYLRWAYNSWTTDPLKDGRFRQWPAGDCFMVYPEGRSSIRMEMLTEGIQDYEKVRILASEWTASGDMEKLEALGKVLEKFTFEELTSEGAEKAVSEARAFIAENM